MKIRIAQIPSEGMLKVEETVGPEVLDLGTEIIKFRSPISIKADVSRITNAISVDLTLNTSVHLVCSRCLEEIEIDFRKHLKLAYTVDKSDSTIDIGPDIRQEIVLDYPIKPLCKLDCKGLCPKCGKNLNLGDCNC